MSESTFSRLLEQLEAGDVDARRDAFADLMAAIDIEDPAAASAALRGHLAAVVDSDELPRWIDRCIDRLDNAEEEWVGLDDYARDRSALEVVLACDPAAVASSRFSRFTLDPWNEKLLVPRLALREPRPAVPRSHWWWFPEPDDPEILDPMEPFGGFELGAGADADALRARAGELTFRSRAAAVAIAATAAHEVAPGDRASDARGAALLRALGRRAVAEGAVVADHPDGGRSRAGVDRFYFHHGRVIAQACIDSGGRAYLGGIEPRARIPADLPVEPAAVVAALARATAATDYRERRLSIAAAMDGLAPIARAVSAGELDADAVGATLAPAIVHRDMFLGWRACVERRLDAERAPIDQLREDRLALGFLLELGDRLDEGMFDELVDLPDVIDDALDR